MSKNRKLNTKHCVNFTKMQGAGNDFVVIDNRSGRLVKNYSKFAKMVCDRKYSVGADGLLAVEKSARSDFRMIYYNSDGSRAEMCGNGARCIAYFCYEKKITGSEMRFETDAGTLFAKVSGCRVKLQMPEPKDLKLDFAVKVAGREMQASYINTGVPHVVIFASDITRIDVNGLGRVIRNSSMFAPAGANVNFARVKQSHNKVFGKQSREAGQSNKIIMRTYERGVEAETFACGTGAVAAALIAGIKGIAKSPVTCITTGGEELKIYFKLTETEGEKDLINPFCDVYLEGKVGISFTGALTI